MSEHIDLGFGRVNLVGLAKPEQTVPGCCALCLDDSGEDEMCPDCLRWWAYWSNLTESERRQEIRIMDEHAAGDGR